MDKITLVLAANLADGQIVAYAAGLGAFTIATPFDAQVTQTPIRALVVTPAFAARLADGDAHPLRVFREAREAAKRSGVVI